MGRRDDCFPYTQKDRERREKHNPPTHPPTHPLTLRHVTRTGQRILILLRKPSDEQSIHTSKDNERRDYSEHHEGELPAGEEEEEGGEQDLCK